MAPVQNAATVTMARLEKPRTHIVSPVGRLAETSFMAASPQVKSAVAATMAAMLLTLPPAPARAPAWARSKPRRPCPASCTHVPLAVAGCNPRSRQPPTIEARGASLPRKVEMACVSLDLLLAREDTKACSASSARIENAALPIGVRPGFGRRSLSLVRWRAFAALPQSHVVAVFASCDLCGPRGRLTPGLPDITSLRGLSWRRRGRRAFSQLCLQCLQLLGRLAAALAGRGGQSVGAVAVECRLFPGLGLTATACNVLLAIEKGRAQLAVGPASEVVQILG